ncbi:PQQ-dependent sugar dehydrogenase [Aurantiacibacter flavus]|uniref:PQQ-dependent sugar dehydrogenase n=1 Tax=Aurantiacibacter flavus TaxID=3145232 RepID=A0ABV0CZB4_9SPHN
MPASTEVDDYAGIAPATEGADALVTSIFQGRGQSLLGGPANGNLPCIVKRLRTIVPVIAISWSLCSCSAPETTSKQAEAMEPDAWSSATPVDVITDLDVPWSMVIVGDEVLVSQRDRMDILAFRLGEEARRLRAVPNAATPLDGGVLGLAAFEEGDLDRNGRSWIYAYHSTASDNRIVRMAYANGALGSPEIVFTGIPAGNGHNGGRIAFGPDGMLYVATGETRQPAFSQDPQSLAGKILRMTPEGGVPEDNPFAGSVVYSMGHRNPQGLAWDDQGHLWETEFGDKEWDELNRIEPGKNYGWPAVQGRADDPDYVDPVVQWRTSVMGPSGLAYFDGTFFVAGLTGQRIWSVTFDAAGRPLTEAHFIGTYGRIRDVAEGPDGTLWFLTNNTDGRGDAPAPDDDRILSVPILSTGSARRQGA